MDQVEGEGDGGESLGRAGAAEAGQQAGLGGVLSCQPPHHQVLGVDREVGRAACQPELQSRTGGEKPGPGHGHQHGEGGEGGPVRRPASHRTVLARLQSRNHPQQEHQ